MDLPEVFHEIDHSPLGYCQCPQPKTTIFDEDATVLVSAEKDQNLQIKLEQSFNQVQDYLRAKKLLRKEK